MPKKTFILEKGTMITIRRFKKSDPVGHLIDNGSKSGQWKFARGFRIKELIEVTAEDREEAIGLLTKLIKERVKEPEDRISFYPRRVKEKKRGKQKPKLIKSFPAKLAHIKRGA